MATYFQTQKMFRVKGYKEGSVLSYSWAVAIVMNSSVQNKNYDGSD